jgi:hypothetical protein
MIQNTLSIAHRIDNLHLTEIDGQTAEEFIHCGEFVADLICRAGAQLRSTAAFMLGDGRIERSKISITPES